MANHSEILFLGGLGLFVFLATINNQQYLSKHQPFLMSMAANFVIGIGIVILVNLTLGSERERDTSLIRGDLESRFSSLAKVVSDLRKKSESQ